MVMLTCNIADHGAIVTLTGHGHYHCDYASLSLISTTSLKTLALNLKTLNLKPYTVNPKA